MIFYKKSNEYGNSSMFDVHHCLTHYDDIENYVDCNDGNNNNEDDAKNNTITPLIMMIINNNDNDNNNNDNIHWVLVPL